MLYDIKWVGIVFKRFVVYFVFCGLRYLIFLLVLGSCAFFFVG